MDGPGEIDSEAGVRELQREVLGYLGGFERLEGDLTAKLANHEILPQTARRRLGSGRGGAQRTDEEHLRTTLTPGKRRNEVQRREVRPMKVLEHEDERTIGGDRFERVADFADHALACHADRVALERLALFG